MSIIELFNAGGLVMWPLLICSLVAVAITIERLFALRRANLLNPTVVERIAGLAEGGRLDRALAFCKENPGMFSGIIASGLEMADLGERESAAKEAVEDAGRHESVKLSRYLGTLGTIVGISPLLGLFGTVIGMIDVFKTIAESGAGQAAALSSGISQALITTATGLLVAIPSLVAYNFLNEKVTYIVSDLESESIRVLRAVYRGEKNSPLEAATVETARASGG